MLNYDDEATVQSEANIKLSMFDKGVSSSEVLSRADEITNNRSYMDDVKTSVLSSGTRPSARNIMQGKLLMSVKKPNQSLLGRYNRNMTTSSSKFAQK